MGSSVNDILDRATTQTCTWPGTLGFVHVDEQGNLSPALTTTFLPRRKNVLERFINDRCDGSAPAPLEPGFTVGGSPEGAAN